MGVWAKGLVGRKSRRAEDGPFTPCVTASDLSRAVRVASRLAVIVVDLEIVIGSKVISRDSPRVASPLPYR
jgi:hypothetical protein